MELIFSKVSSLTWQICSFWKNKTQSLVKSARNKS